MALSTQPYKGTRDFYPEDMRLRKWMFDKWREACEQFGYEEYDGPVLEPLELYTAKTSEEVVNEQSYSFTDRGDRKVIMRPEMTPTVSRMVAARRQELAYPLRLYSMANFFRYERPQKGRLREFWQLNVDIFGEKGISADIEIIQLADAIMKAFDAKPSMYEIRVNSRLLLSKRIKEAGLITDESKVINILDTYRIVDREAIKNKLADYVRNPEELLRSLEKDGPSEEVKNLKNQSKNMGIEVKTVETLARGFDYYTDIVFEVFDTNPDNNRSMFGGGRYDGLVGLFGVDPVPTVGFGMGDVTFTNFLEAHGLLPKLSSRLDATLILIGDVYSEASKLAKSLRQEGLNVSIDATDRRLDKKIKSADKQGVKTVVFVGEKELEEGVYPIKVLATGKEDKLSPERLISTLKDYRNN